MTSATTTTAKKEEGTRIRIKIRAYDNKIIDQATKVIIETAERSCFRTAPYDLVRYRILSDTALHIL